MKFLKSPTTPQKWMIALMGMSVFLLLLWTVIELIGVFNRRPEDTYSEWVFDLHVFWVIAIVLFHLVWGFLLIGSAWHFLEGWYRRRRIERGERINE